MSRGESLSMTTIIVAALSVLVLVVLAIIFGGKMKIFGSETRNCRNLGGTCEADGCESNEASISNTDCAVYCCLDTYTSAADD